MRYFNTSPHNKMSHFDCPNCGHSLTVSKAQGSPRNQFHSAIPASFGPRIPAGLRRQLGRPQFHLVIAPFTFVGSLIIFDPITAIAAFGVIHTSAAVFLILPGSRASEEEIDNRPKPTKSIVVEVHHNTSADYHVRRPEFEGITEKDIMTFARYAARDKIALSDLRPKSKGKPFSDGIARRILDVMTDAGYLRYKNPGAKTQGRTVSRKGAALFRALAEGDYKII